MKKLKIGLILLIVLLFSVSANAEIYFIVTQPTNLYKSPGENKITEIAPGYNFSQSYVLEQKGDWFKIEYNSQEGWILNKYLDFSENKPDVQEENEDNSNNDPPPQNNQSNNQPDFHFRNVGFQASGLPGWTKVTGEIMSNKGFFDTVVCELSLYEDTKLINSFYVYASNIGDTYGGFSSELNIDVSAFNRYKIRVIETY